MIISVYEGFWIVFGFSVLIFFVFYFPYFFGLVDRFVKLSAFEYFFVYVLIFFRSFEFGFLDLSFVLFSQDFIFRVLLNLFFSFVVCLLGLFVLYFLVFKRSETVDFEAGFFSIFIFCFSICFVVFFEIVRYFLNYVFGLSFFNYNLSGSLGFILVHFFGSFFISFVCYLYLVGDDKHGVVRFFKRFFGISEKFNSKYHIFDLIKMGESERVEFKESLRTNVHTKKLDKRMEHSVLKTVCSFLNSKGGILFIGVSDLGDIVGLDIDNFKNSDKCKLQLMNMVKQHIGNSFAANVLVEDISLDYGLKGSGFFLKVEVFSSKKEAFLIWEGKSEFYVRVGPSSVILSGQDLVDYVFTRFKK